MTRQARFEEKPQVNESEKAVEDVRLEQAMSTTTGTDFDKGSSRYANSELGLEHREGVNQAEKKLVRKLDRVILPLTALLYVCLGHRYFCPGTDFRVFCLIVIVSIDYFPWCYIFSNFLSAFTSAYLDRGMFPLRHDVRDIPLK